MGTLLVGVDRVFDVRLSGDVVRVEGWSPRVYVQRWSGRESQVSSERCGAVGQENARFVQLLDFSWVGAYSCCLVVVGWTVVSSDELRAF